VFLVKLAKTECNDRIHIAYMHSYQNLLDDLAKQAHAFFSCFQSYRRDLAVGLLGESCLSCEERHKCQWRSLLD